MVDQQGPGGKPFALAESGAMLFYLASKTGKFLPKDLRKRWQVMQWVMTQMGHVGPMLGQAHHFLGYAPEKIEYAMNRYKNEANRLYGVLDRQLARLARNVAPSTAQPHVSELLGRLLHQLR